MRPTRDCLVLFTRVPIPGSVKTRLCPPLTPEQASELHTSFLLDVAEGSRELKAERPDLRILLAAHPFELRGELPEAVGNRPGVEVVAQLGQDLGSRMAAMFRQCFEFGAERVVIRNTDSPTLPNDRIREAFAGLERDGVDSVIGPDDGGGYYLLGLRRMIPELFEQIPLGSQTEGATVFGATMDVMRSLGASSLVLASEPDCDVPDDLDRLASELGARPEAAPNTAKMLASIGRIAG